MNDFFTRPLWLTTTGYHRAVVLTKLAAIAQQNGAKFPEPQSYECEREIHHRYSDKMIFTRYKSYIKFIVGDTYYYLEADDNPFFGARIIKAKMNSPKTYKEVYLEEFKYFYYDPLFELNASDEVLQECAEQIWCGLMERDYCEPVLSTEAVNVPNTYNGGWHKEIRVLPQREVPI